MDLDRLQKHRVQLLCEEFIASIDPSKVCSLATLHNSNRPCSVFAEAQKGSYNICYFVQFDHIDGEEQSHQRWVVRFPLPSVYDAIEKLKSEIATMKYVVENTSIPVPRVHGYGFGSDEENPTGLPFILMDYVQGKKWRGSDLPKLPEETSHKFYQQLGGILSQLRCQEFSRIGSLVLSEDGSSWKASNRPLSQDLNDLSVWELDPSGIMDRTFGSTVEYLFALYALLYHRFKKQRNSVYDEEDAKEKIFALEQFRAILFRWIKQEENYGPFVLMHGDLRPSNIIIDDDFNILSIVDWEWSRTVPLQLFTPPTWLTGYDAGAVVKSYFQVPYIFEYMKFWAALPKQKDNRKALRNTWTGAMSTKPSLYIPSALHRFCEFENIYWEALHNRSHSVITDSMIDTFLHQRDNADLLDLVHQKVEDLKSYQIDLEASGIPLDLPKELDGGDTIPNGTVEWKVQEKSERPLDEAPSQEPGKPPVQSAATEADDQIEKKSGPSEVEASVKARKNASVRRIVFLMKRRIRDSQKLVHKNLEVLRVRHPERTSRSLS